jgi:cell division septal protein FtsQ
MRIFSSHRKKLEPRRRFGTRNFQDKIKSAANYKRAFNVNPTFFKSWKFWKFVVGGAIAILFYFLVISSSLLITHISVTGNQTVPTQTIINAVNQAGNNRFFLIKKDNYFLMTQGRVNTMVTRVIPEIKYITSNRTWPNQIHLTIHERTLGFAIQSANQYFLVDDEGTIFKQIESPMNLLLVQDQLTEDFATGELLNAKLAPFVVSMSKLWPSKITTPVSLVKFPGKASTEAEFVSSEGWSVIFDTSRPAANSLANLTAILNKIIPARDRSRLAYIDLRLTTWAYYCFKATPCSQTPQQETAGATTDVKK